MDIFGDLRRTTKKPACFGATGERQVYPLGKIPSKFGATLDPIRGDPHVGPGSYQNEEFTNLSFKIDSFSASRRGYSLGARTASKITPHGGPHWVNPIGVTQTPAPETYQKDNTAPRRFKHNRHPFDAASKRFGKTVAEPDLPGPGAYDHDMERNKHVQLAGSFGGAQTHLIPIELQTSIKKLLTETELKKHRRRLTYLNLYW